MTEKKPREPIITDGLLRLERWLAQSGESRARFAERAGVSGASVSAWFTGFSRPKQPVRERMHGITGIEPSAWATDKERAFGRGETLPDEGGA